jgi:hypothetical protein
MDLEETEARNDYAGEGHQQYNRQTYIRGLNLVAIKRTTVQMTRQPLYNELHKLGYDLMRQDQTNRGLIYVYIVHIY